MQMQWFTLDWAKRWGLPICALAVGLGAFSGAVWYRWIDAPSAVSARPFAPATTTTVTTTAERPVTQVVERTTTSTVQAPPATVRTTVEKAPRIAVETRTVVARPPEPETVRTTVTETERPALQVGLPGEEERGRRNGQ